jgi:hypothetical protein
LNRLSYRRHDRRRLVRRGNGRRSQTVGLVAPVFSRRTRVRQLASKIVDGAFKSEQTAVRRWSREQILAIRARADCTNLTFSRATFVV